MSRVGFIGDCHGHEHELVTMIRKLEAQGVDRIVLLGDMLDRGPRSLRCLRLVREQRFCSRRGYRDLDMVKGNHEDAYLRVLDGVPKPGREIVEQPEDRRLSRLLRPADVRHMRRLPISLNLPKLVVTAVHGGVTPHMDTMDEFALRVRFLDADYQPMRSTMPSDVFWADVYDGRFGLIVFGHESHLHPTLYENALALDGEGYSRLHGAIISDETGDDWVRSWTIHYGEHRARESVISDRPCRFHGQQLYGRRWEGLVYEGPGRTRP